MNHYQILGVEIGSSSSVIRSAFRRRAIQIHPDKLLASDDHHEDLRFVRLMEAYRVLGDARRREAYDKRHGFHRPQNVLVSVSVSVSGPDAESSGDEVSVCASSLREDLQLAMSMDGDVADEVDLDDLSSLWIPFQSPSPTSPTSSVGFSDESAANGGQWVWIHVCRCSEKCVITETDLESGIQLFPCAQCSLVVRVLYSPIPGTT
eukprot:ANDGO_02039.mRNA.1 Chaperone protein DnaJ